MHCLNVHNYPAHGVTTIRTLPGEKRKPRRVKFPVRSITLALQARIETVLVSPEPVLLKTSPTQSSGVRIQRDDNGKATSKVLTNRKILSAPLVWGQRQTLRQTLT